MELIDGLTAFKRQNRKAVYKSTSVQRCGILQKHITTFTSNGNWEVVALYTQLMREL